VHTPAASPVSCQDESVWLCRAARARPDRIDAHATYRSNCGGDDDAAEEDEEEAEEVEDVMNTTPRSRTPW
jgi:hypothetical protein